MTTKELIHIAKTIGATEIVSEENASTIDVDKIICSTQGSYGVNAILFKATDNKYYYIGKPYGFIYKLID